MEVQKQQSKRPITAYIPCGVSTLLKSIHSQSQVHKPNGR